ncbi:translocation/assembly module TamB domain-containing protein [Thiomicrorhabdus arctica]|uniref:translocation/assembly module TamB domain-containing protein n=1 Tax=Thiomicrorhabdus arctica TaxID=131540 RepID=UPI000378290D|nr:translocation/assembly module TamB domain-containing protein [Thiomicrorhabdus arctica]
MKRPNLKHAAAFFKGFWVITLSISALILILFLIVVSLLLWHPQSAKTALPYLEKFTGGQLQIESAEGQLVDGLTLTNIRFNSPTIHLHIDQMKWQWRLSALINRHIDFQEIDITKPTIKLIGSRPKTDASTTEPFAFFSQLESYHVLFDVDHISITQASLQLENKPAIEIAQLDTGIHWQDKTLTLENLKTEYQTYRLHANSRFEVLSATKFKADLDLNLLGLEGIKSLKLVTQASGGLQQVHLNVEMIEPYTMHSEHVLKMDQSTIQLDSQFKQLKAKLNEQWQINQLQGQNSLRFNLNNKVLVSQGKLNINLKDKPLTELEYSTEYDPSGMTKFELKTDFKKMGGLKVQGQANLQNLPSLEMLTAKATVQTEQLNLQWLDPKLNYQINSLFDFTLSDYHTLTSQLSIKQLDVTGLPEAMAFKGIVKTQRHKVAKTKGASSTQSNVTDSDYAINIQSAQLTYAAYSGKVQAKLFIKPDFSRIEIPSAKLSLGDNSIDFNGQWAETFKLSLNAKLNQLHQLYAPLSGKVTAKVNANGRLLKDFSGFEQAWSTLKIDAENLRYPLPNSPNQEALTLKKVTLNAKVPLHKLALSTFAITADTVLQTSNIAENRVLFSKISAIRQASKTGISSDVKVQHPELSFHAQLYEAKPNLKQQSIILRRFDIKQPQTGSWQLAQPRQIEWKAPRQIKTEEICLQSVDNAEAKLCLQAQNDYAKWSMNAFPIFDWIKPWLSDTLSLKGRLNGEGSLTWKNELTMQQTLLIPQLDVMVTEQGYKVPFVIRNWQTDIQLDSKKASLKSLANINETGRLNAEIHAENKNNQAWSDAKLNGKIHLNLTQWPLKGRILELVELNKTELNIESLLSGNLKTLHHDTQANIDLDLNLPLLGLKNQAIQLQAQLTPQAIEAKGVWKQQENQTEKRRADLTLKLTQLDTQPKLLAHFDTQSIELLKTPFAHLITSANMEVTLAKGATHILGQVQLQDSELNLDEMPLHQRTSTSDDEIIINAQGQVVPKEDSTSNLSYDIKIGFGQNVKVNVQNSQLFLGGELQLVKTLNSPEMKAFGEVKLREGYINLDARNRIQVDGSSFIFNGMIGNPTLNVNLYRVVDQTTARLNITGNASQPQFVFYSTPALSQGRIINLMVFGRAGDMSKEPNYESQVLSAFYKLGIQNNTPVLNTLTSTLGIQDVYFDVQGQKVSSLLVGRSLTDKLYVRYAKDLTGQQNNAVQFFYQLTNKWLLKTNSGDNNSSVDLIYRLER